MREALLEIQEELQNEEESRMNEFFLDESKELDSKVKLFLHDDLICPICQVRRCLHDTINNHNNSCNSTFSFSVIEEENGGSNILVTCSFCDWMSFLI
ncbi:hypothetical protein Avbf_15357 [Armadillidium vulgare]|nr:hypothetical protein Avbf_15357 [Armadillidium vulgare]